MTQHTYLPAPAIVGDHLSPQSKRVLDMMEANGRSISAREAMLDLDITSATLARRVCDLEDAGLIIYRERNVNPGTGKRYTRYHFDPVRTTAPKAKTQAA